MVYVSYHIFEHYSSVRNLAGPHKGPPRIKEVRMGPELASKRRSAHRVDVSVDPIVDHLALRRTGTSCRVVHQGPRSRRIGQVRVAFAPPRSQGLGGRYPSTFAEG